MSATTTKRLTERFAAPLTGSRVDRDQGIIRDVLLCGTTSANGRSYPWGKGLTCDPRKYEGRVVNADHGAKASVSRRLGWIENVRVGDDGRPRADLHILTSHPNGPAVLEAAERNPNLFGLSHVAVCRTRMDKGTEVIESVESVESVDLVADPATTKSLYESTQPMPTTLRTFLEAVGAKKPAAAKWAKAKWLREMDEMSMDLPPVEDMPADGADDAVMSAFKTAISSVVDQAMSGSMDPKEALGKIKALLRSHGDINGDGKVDAADIDAADDAPAETEDDYEEKAMESVLAAADTLTDAGLKITRESLALVAKMPATDRPALLKLVRESSAGEKPRTSGRETKTVTESKASEPKPEVKAAVAAFLRS